MPLPRDWSGVVEDVRRALAPKGRQQLGQFVIEGARLVERAIRAEQPPRRLVISDRLLRQHDKRVGSLLTELERTGCQVYAVPDAVVLELAEGRAGAGMFGLCELPRALSARELLTLARELGRPLLVLVNVEEPGNVGALVRTALAAGSVGIVALGVSDPFHPKAVRTSMGGVFKLPILRSVDPEPVLAELDAFDCVAAVVHGGESPPKAGLHRVAAILIGSEAEGLPVGIVERIGRRVSIPMPTGVVDSYSVNAAAAILLYEAQRSAQLSANPAGTSSSQ